MPLNLIDPRNHAQQREAFECAALSVAILLQHKFPNEKLQKSRELDPIVGVSFTGLFDFFVNLFGRAYLVWWQNGRPETLMGIVYIETEQKYLETWKKIVFETVEKYCKKHSLKIPNRCTTLQPEGCLLYNALRIFDQGLMYADEHMGENEGEVDLKLYKLSVRNGVPITKGISNNKLDLIRVTLKNNRQLTMTKHHRLAIQGQWVAAEDMQPGQIIDSSIGEYRKASEAFLEYVDVDSIGRGRVPQICQLPSEMSPSLAYFIGAIYGNGCFKKNNYRIKISHGNLKVLEKLSYIAQSLFGLTGTFYKFKKADKQELCFSNKHLYTWFQHNELSKVEKSKDLDRIPLKVRQSSRESILAFFAGLIDTDGCIRKQGSLSIDSASEDFIRNLQQVGEAVGLCFSIFHNTEGENLQGQKDMWGLCLSRMKSNEDSLEFLNTWSLKAQAKPLTPSQRQFKFEPYEIIKIEHGIQDYTYDYGIDGENYEDSWYWQGALKSHNTKSLLSGASPGWHPPIASQFIRRITFPKNHPVALACIDYGYSVIPSIRDKDENGKLLDDPYCEECTEWLIEIPVKASWGDVDTTGIDPNKFSVKAQFDFCMQVQKYYVTHNTSSTLMFREHEIEELGTLIYQSIQNDEGYISAALLARMDDFESFPRLPYEPISEDRYYEIVNLNHRRRLSEDFGQLLAKYDQGKEQAPMSCDSNKCFRE